MVRIFSMLLLVCFLCACGAFGPTEIKDQPLQGILDGKPFALKSGLAIVCRNGVLIYFFKRESTSVCSRKDRVKEALQSVFVDGYVLLQILDKQQLSSSISPFGNAQMTFHKPIGETILTDELPMTSAISGSVELSGITKQQIKGKLQAFGNLKNQLNGHFTFETCQQPERSIEDFKGK